MGYLIHHIGFYLCSAHLSNYGLSSGNSMLKLQIVHCIHTAFFQKIVGTVCYLKHNHNDEITDLCVKSLLYFQLEGGICERKLVKLLSVISDHQISCSSPVWNILSV